MAAEAPPVFRSRRLMDADFDVELLPAPWTATAPYDEAAASRLAVPNPVLLLHLPPGAHERQVGRQVRRLHRLHPGAPLVLCGVGGRAGQEHMERLAREWGVRAVSPAVPVDPELLRAQLTDAADLGHDVACWSRDTGRVPTELAGLVERLVAATDRWQTLAGVCRTLALQQRSVRRAFRPSAVRAGALVHMAVRLRLALRLQQMHDRRPGDVAHVLGFSTDDLGKRLRPTFGLSPREVQQLLGIAPLLERWWRRQQDHGSE
jgi:hypothetical protein